MAASEDLQDLIEAEAKKIAERDLKRLLKLIRKQLRELHDPFEDD